MTTTCSKCGEALTADNELSICGENGTHHWNERPYGDLADESYYTGGEYAADGTKKITPPGKLHNREIVYSYLEYLYKNRYKLNASIATRAQTEDHCFGHMYFTVEDLIQGLKAIQLMFAAGQLAGDPASAMKRLKHHLDTLLPREQARMLKHAEETAAYIREHPYEEREEE